MDDKIINVLVFNIFSGGLKRGRDRGMSDELIVDSWHRFIAYSGAHIILIQEVDHGTVRTRGVDIPECLVSRLPVLEGLHWEERFARAIDLAPGCYGNAVLSCFPIYKHQEIPLGKDPEDLGEKEERVAVAAKIKVPIDDDSGAVIGVWFVCLHLGLSASSQVYQLKRLAAVLNTFHPKAHIILAGDFNINRYLDSEHLLMYSELMALLNAGLCHREHFVDLGPEELMEAEAKTCPEACVTFPGRKGGKKIDYIFHSHGQDRTLHIQEICVLKESGGVFGEEALSDHYPIQLKFKIC